MDRQGLTFPPRKSCLETPHYSVTKVGMSPYFCACRRDLWIQLQLRLLCSNTAQFLDAECHECMILNLCSLHVLSLRRHMRVNNFKNRYFILFNV